MPETLSQQLAFDIARAVDPSEFDHAATQELTAFDEITRSAAPRLACCEGCSLCCWLRVDLFAHEVFLIARHIRAQFSTEDLMSLMVRLKSHAERVLPLSPFEHATQNIQCPLLVHGRCSVYEMRPHSCRRHHSKDFAACQFTFDHPTDLEFPGAHDRELFQRLSQAMKSGVEIYAQSDFDCTIYELGTALHESLLDSSSWRRWQNHEQAFLTASITPAA